MILILYKQLNIIRRFVAFLLAAVCMCFFVVPLEVAQAQGVTVVQGSVLSLPNPGAMVRLSPNFTPPIMAGMTIHPDNPLQFDFIIDKGDAPIKPEDFRAESEKLVSYFMASLTVPEDEMWVNLSPTEKNRIVADGLGDTIMGRDMLAQDYLLKQLTASLMYPEDELGKKFWERIFKETGLKQVPTSTLNKVWIIPEKAEIYINGNNIFVADSHLKVMMEEDYRELRQPLMAKPKVDDYDKKWTTQIIRETLLPAIEHEVNNGQNFANLRQIYHSMILATWYKNNLKESLLGKVFADQNKTLGIDTQDKNVTDKIYNQYLEAFKRGVFDYIKDEYDENAQNVIPRKYFSGGEDFAQLSNIKEVFRVLTPNNKLIARQGNMVHVSVRSELITDESAAMSTPGAVAFNEEVYHMLISTQQPDIDEGIRVLTSELTDPDEIHNTVKRAIEHKGLELRYRSLGSDIHGAHDLYKGNDRIGGFDFHLDGSAKSITIEPITDEFNGQRLGRLMLIYFLTDPRHREILAGRFVQGPDPQGHLTAAFESIEFLEVETDVDDDHLSDYRFLYPDWGHSAAMTSKASESVSAVHTMTEEEDFAYSALSQMDTIVAHRRIKDQGRLVLRFEPFEYTVNKRLYLSIPDNNRDVIRDLIVRRKLQIRIHSLSEPAGAKMSSFSKPKLFGPDDYKQGDILDITPLFEESSLTGLISIELSVDKTETSLPEGMQMNVMHLKEETDDEKQNLGRFWHIIALLISEDKGKIDLGLRLVRALKDPDVKHAIASEVFKHKGIELEEIIYEEAKPPQVRIILRRKDPNVLSHMPGVNFFYKLTDAVEIVSIVSIVPPGQRLTPLLFLWWSTHKDYRRKLAGMPIRIAVDPPVNDGYTKMGVVIALRKAGFKAEVIDRQPGESPGERNERVKLAGIFPGDHAMAIVAPEGGDHAMNIPNTKTANKQNFIEYALEKSNKDPKLDYVIGAKTARIGSRVQLQLTESIHQRITPVRYIKDKKLNANVIVLRDEFNPENSIVFLNSEGVVRVISDDEEEREVLGDGKYHKLKDLKAGQRFLRNLKVRAVKTHTVDRFSEDGDPMAFTALLSELTVSLVPVSEGQDRVWVTGFNNARSEVISSGDIESAFLVDLKSFDTSLPKNEEEIATSDDFLTFTHAHWSAPDVILYWDDSNESHYYYKVKEAQKGETPHYIYKRIKKSDALLVITVNRDEQHFVIDDLTIDNVPLRIEMGYVNISGLLFILNYFKRENEHDLTSRIYIPSTAVDGKLILSERQFAERGTVRIPTRFIKTPDGWLFSAHHTFNWPITNEVGAQIKIENMHRNMKPTFESMLGHLESPFDSEAANAMVSKTPEGGADDRIFDMPSAITPTPLSQAMTTGEGINISIPMKSKPQSAFRYFILNKPAEVLSSRNDSHGSRQTIYELFQEKTSLDSDEYRTLGRLDRETEGLTILSNDGSLSVMLLNQNKTIKEYEVVVPEGELSEEQIKQLKRGVEIADQSRKTGESRTEMVKAIDAWIVDDGSKKTLRIKISVGRNRVVRKMMEKVGYPDIYLRRIAIGAISLDKIQVEKGEVLELTEESLGWLIGNRDRELLYNRRGLDFIKQKRYTAGILNISNWKFKPIQDFVYDEIMILFQKEHWQRTILEVFIERLIPIHKVLPEVLAFEREFILTILRGLYGYYPRSRSRISDLVFPYLSRDEQTYVSQAMMTAAPEGEDYAMAEDETNPAEDEEKEKIETKVLGVHKLKEVDGEPEITFVQVSQLTENQQSQLREWDGLLGLHADIDTKQFTVLALNGKQELVGFYQTEPLPKKDDIYAKVVLVRKDMRGKGIGMRLTFEVMKELRAKGRFEKVRALISSNHPEAYRFAIKRQKVFGKDVVTVEREYDEFGNVNMIFDLKKFNPNKERYDFDLSEAMTVNKTPGGIDFNPKMLELEQSGADIQFNFDPAMFNDLTPDDVLGIRPVIINIQPVTNLPMLLGMINEPNLAPGAESVPLANHVPAEEYQLQAMLREDWKFLN